MKGSPMRQLRSPVKDIRNSEYQSAQQQYQQQFWKLKAQRLEAKIQEVTKDNQGLIKKLMQSQRRQKSLNQKLSELQYTEKTRRSEDDKNQQESRMVDMMAKQEIERLTKEIRLLKNKYEIESSKQQEEFKKLKRKNTELQDKQLQSVSAQIHQNKMKILEDQIAQIKKQLSITQQNLQKAREERKTIGEQNQDLRKQIQLLNVKTRLIEKEQELKLSDYRRYERLIIQHRTQRSEGLRQQNISAQIQKDFSFDSVKKQVSKNNKQCQMINKINSLTSQLQKTSKLYQDSLKWKQQNMKSQIRIKEIESQLIDTKEELKSVIQRLAPLLHQKKALEGRENVEVIASLSLLELFLVKYKIQAF